MFDVRYWEKAKKILCKDSVEIQNEKIKEILKFQRGIDNE